MLELIVGIGVVALLAAILVPSLETFRERARKAKCISNLRAIHNGLLSYTMDKGHWPQMEDDKFDFGEEEFFGFWIEETKAYGLSEETWVCPSDRALERRLNEDKIRYFGSYVVTRFDKKAQTPFRWNNPWVMERGDLHGQGAHILMPDGSVHSSRNPFSGR
ncbi:MAG: type II secretion system protein [Verrucomicrobiota bacterium]